MGRSEKPATGPATPFANALRELRDNAGTPSYRQMSQRTAGQYSPSTLSKAANGERLPNLATTLAYVRACRGDEHAWEQRWKATAARAGSNVSMAPKPYPPVTAPAAVMMPSTDRRVDPLSATSPAEFALQLRILRIHAENPSYKSLEARTSYASSTVHTALHSERLPSLPLVRAIVQALGDDPEIWTQAWKNVAINEEQRAAAPAEPPKLRLVDPETPQRNAI